MTHPVSIKGVVLVGDRVVLVKNPRGEWELPGGRPEPGEDHSRTLAREIAEELSIRISNAELIDSHVFEVIPGRHISIITYGCTLAGPFAPRLSDEHLEHCLWPVRRLSEINLPAGYRRAVQAWATRRRIELGLGLVGIGREWGAGDRSIPSEQQTAELLREALALKIRFLDTAPSYGHSEARLGRFLRGLSNDERRSLYVATKFGEHWVDGAAVVDHTYDALCRSLDRSLERLGAIDLLQIHKCNSVVLASPDVRRAIEYARGVGVRSIGASVSDVTSCEMAAAATFVDAIQLPLNSRRRQLIEAARAARVLGKRVIANRPVDSGALLAEASLHQCFSFVVRQDAADTILTGTRSASHLRDNYRAFQSALDDADPSLRAHG